MRIEGVPFSTIDWDKIPATGHLGETGKATWQSVEQGNLRVRKVEYSAGYKADHWCSRKLQDGRTFALKAGETYVVADDAEPHRSQTAVGAKLFIVD